MTVAEMIEKLKKFPSGAIVVVDGYEGGVDTAKEPRQVTIFKDALKNYGYYGDHLVKDSVEYRVYWTKREPDYPEVQAVLIGWREKDEEEDPS